MESLRWARWGAALGFVGVGLGAFGAHGLKGRVGPDLLATFEIGVRYQMYHALALVLLSRTASGTAAARAGRCFVGGTLVFSGSLYLLTFTGIRTWGAVTPFGGLALLAGWLFWWRGMGEAGA